ncbi:MAG: hypothetical protein WCL56_10045 [Sediminibacterium sp.]|jgi:hypothetical protein
MKKILLSLIVSASLIACTNQETKIDGQTVPTNATGYTIDSSANTDLVKRSSNALANNDTIEYRNTYSSNVVFHDNNDSQNLTQNMVGIKAMFDKGIVWKLNKFEAIWETVYKKANEKGVSNYVNSYSNFTLTKGGKSINVIFSVVDAIKDGKQVEEWLVYDKSGIAELMK